MADLKNIRQIGSPAETDKIYIENNAYQRIHREEFPERRVFVLMGHTECAPTGYSTFVEAVIPVWDIAFSQGIPVWNNHVWNDVFQEVKRSYENSVIIGWAMDIKGMPPRVTAELEAVHREQFGGAHQLLFLLDTLEQDEYFYQTRSGRLRQKEGFYIYFDSEYSNVIPESIWNVKMAQREQMEEKESKEKEAEKENEDHSERWDVIRVEQEGKTYGTPRARYREIMYGQTQQKNEDNGKWVSSFAIIAAIVLLIAIVGTAIKQGRFSMDAVQQAVESISMKVLPQSEDAQQDSIAETETEDIPTMLKNMEKAQENEEITIEEVPGGEIGSN